MCVAATVGVVVACDVDGDDGVCVATAYTVDRVLLIVLLIMCMCNTRLVMCC